jgi:hypothetical protein
VRESHIRTRLFLVFFKGDGDGFAADSLQVPANLAKFLASPQKIPCSAE